MEIPKSLLFIDNSNFYISTQRCKAVRLGYKRANLKILNTNIDYEKLLTLCEKGRTFGIRKIYGAGIDDESKRHFNRIGLNVSQSPRSISGKEKQADTQMAVDATEAIVEYGNKTKKHGGTVVLVTGDVDLLPVTDVAKRWGWNVELLCYEHSMGREFVGIQNSVNLMDTELTIRHLDGDVDDFTNLKPYVPKGTEPEIIITIREGFSFYNGLREVKRKSIELEFVNIAKSVFDLPTYISQSQPVDEASSADYNLKLIFCVRDTKVYNFQADILEKLEKFQTELQSFWKGDGFEPKEIVVRTSPKSKNKTDSFRTAGPDEQQGSSYKKGPSPNNGVKNMAYCNFCKKEFAHPKNNCPEYKKYAK